MITATELESKIAELLDDFYRRRLAKISTLRLEHALRRKNPYLYRAVGIEQASEIVGQLLSAYVSSSDEGIFGDAFFEPLAKYVSGGSVSPSEGVDVAIETDTTYIAIAVKSGTAVFNAQSRARQVHDFNSLRQRLLKLHKQFDPLVGYCYGRKSRSGADFRELAGQAFWRELTGEDDFYLKIIRCMKERPLAHAAEYKKAFAAAVNRFTAQFIERFCDPNGAIDWDKLLEFNSSEAEPGRPPSERTRRPSSN